MRILCADFFGPAMSFIAEDPEEVVRWTSLRPFRT